MGESPLYRAGEVLDSFIDVLDLPSSARDLPLFLPPYPFAASLAYLDFEPFFIKVVFSISDRSSLKSLP